MGGVSPQSGLIRGFVRRYETGTRKCGLTVGDADQQIPRLMATLRGMGQLPLLPPSVGGWPAGGGWLTTAAALARVQAAQLITESATLPSEATTMPTRQRVEYIRRLLGVDHFSTRSSDAISQVADRLPPAIAIAACTPEYLVSG